MISKAVNDQIRSINEYMRENPDDFRDCIKNEFLGIGAHLDNILDEKQNLIIERNLLLIRAGIEEENDDEYGEEFNRRYNDKDMIRLGAYYLLMVKSSSLEALSIPNELVYLTVNAMRQVSFEEYSVAMAGLTHSDLTVRLLEEGNPVKTSIIFNKLTDKIIANDFGYDGSDIDSVIGKFISEEVDSRFPRDIKKV